MRDGSSEAAFRGGSGSPLVCLHGFTATWAAWKPVLPALAARHRVFAPTLPGHCGGPPLGTGVDLSLDRLVDEVEALLDEEGMGSPHLVGNSAGGWLALALAARGRARSVVALAPGGGWPPGSSTDRRIRRFFAVNQFALRYTAGSADKIARRPVLRRIALRDVMAHPERISPAEAASIIRSAADCSLADPLLRHWRNRGLPLEIKAVECPVRIVWGAKDRVLPAERCAAGLTAIPQAEWFLLPDAGHVPMYDEPERVSELILQATDGTSKAAVPSTTT